MHRKKSEGRTSDFPREEPAVIFQQTKEEKAGSLSGIEGFYEPEQRPSVSPQSKGRTLIRVWLCAAGAPNLKVSLGIKNEHTVLAGCDSEFTTPNGKTTCPSKEYEIATTGRHPCPGSEKHRTLHTIDALRALEICRKAELTDDEILAVVSGCGD
jgi:hypothetical protein